MLADVRNVLQFEAEQVLGSNARAIVRESAGIWWTCQIVGSANGEDVNELIFGDSLAHLMYQAENRLKALERVGKAMQAA